MQLEEFMKLTAQEIASITESDKAVWSRYFNGRQGIAERTLVRYSTALGMTSLALLEGIQLRREAKASR
jgi:hypothetical protein